MAKGAPTLVLLLIGLLLGACGKATCDRPSYYLNSGSNMERKLRIPFVPLLPM